MSHNTSALAPYITEHTAALATAGAGQSLVIKGFGLGLSTVVDIPAALGVETARAFTKTGATAGVLTITLTVAAIPDPVVNRSIAISMGGVPAQGPDVTAGAIYIYHGWTPSVLCTGTHDYWWNPDSLSLTDGDNVASFADSVNGLTLIEGDAANQPTFKDSNFVWSGSKTAAALVATFSTQLPDTVIPLKEIGGVATACTVACVMKDSVSTQHYKMQLGVGMGDASKRFGIDIRSNAQSARYPGGSVSGGGSWSGGILTPILTAGGGSGSYTVPEQSIDETFTFTPAAAPTTSPSFATWHHYLGEVLILSKKLTASEITQLRSYWAVKYGS